MDGKKLKVLAMTTESGNEVSYVREISANNGNYNEKVDKNYLQIHGGTVNVSISEQSQTQIQNITSSQNGNSPDNCSKSTSQTSAMMAFTIAGELNEADLKFLKSIVEALRIKSGDPNLIIFTVSKGSIRLCLSGSEDGLGRLKSLFDSGRLNEILGKTVENAQIINTDAENIDESLNIDRKAVLVRIIIEQQNRLLPNLTYSDLSEANLIEANLIGVNLSGANLSRANLIEANLSRTNLIEANLIEANLSRANLSRANLSRANLSRANLIGADLSGADLSESNLNRIHLSSANLSRANLSRANLSRARFFRSDLSVANLIGANLIGANLSEAELRGANLSGADLSGVELRGTDLSGSDLSGADLSGANLIGANLYLTDLHTTRVEYAKFGYNRGINMNLQRQLIARGAIFEDSLGDPSGVLAHR
jgi:uncharacterized protein YjbI with pentapeptide repeats